MPQRDARSRSRRSVLDRSRAKVGKRREGIDIARTSVGTNEVFIHVLMRRATTRLSLMLLSALATAVLAHNDSAVCVLTMYDYHSFATWGALVMRRTVLWARA